MRFFDLRFIDITSELLHLSTHAAMLRNGHDALIAAERARIRSAPELQEEDEDGVAEQTADWLEGYLDDGVTTRHLLNATLVTTWAVYETAVIEIAAYAQERLEIMLSMHDLNGGFVQRARRYFDDVLRLDLYPIDTDWTRLELLAKLRNILAHTGGTLRAMKPRDRVTVTQWSTAHPGVRIVRGNYLVLSHDFTDMARDTVDDLLTELVDRVRRIFP